MVTVEDHNVVGGLGSAVCELAADRCPCRVKRLGVQDLYPESGEAHELLEKYGMGAKAIALAAVEALEGKG